MYDYYTHYPSLMTANPVHYIGPPSKYSWATGDWGSCSRSCGGGQQTRTLRCLRKVTYQREEVVAHSLCPVISPAQVQPCHTQACPPEWSTGSWSQVSTSIDTWRDSIQGGNFRQNTFYNFLA